MTTDLNALLAELENKGVRYIKIGLTDIDGLLRGKYLSLDKFASVAKSSAGFCDCIFGWDSNDQLYDNATFSSWDKAFPDVDFRIDLSTRRALPYEGHTPFFLCELVPRENEAHHGICPRNILRRVLAKARDMGLAASLGFEFEFFVFKETPQSAREKNYRDLVPLTPANCGYSVLRSSVYSELHQEFLEYCDQMKLDLEGYHTETGPGVMEGALTVQPALEAADRAASL